MGREVYQPNPRNEPQQTSLVGEASQFRFPRQERIVIRVIEAQVDVQAGVK